ncbi:MAG: acetamidase/formamidase family protein [Acidobacteriia bacterium]|nr:acetamidase/formamidase family protein [Terriglobia bacterium]
MQKLPFLLLGLAATLAAADVGGSWRFYFISFGEETAPARLEIKVSGEKLSGNLNEVKIEGTVQNGVVQFTGKRPNGKEFGKLEGRLSGEELTGTAHIGGEDRKWIARRVPASAGAAPQTRTFEPTQFHRYFSGTIPPALHINPGDTVRTTTVDAGGGDAKGTRRSNGGNPETGPFYVEGAMPGDTLVVKLNRIRLNRDSAFSGGQIIPYALDPGYLHDAKYDDKFDSEWKLDREGGLARLAKPSEHLKDFRVKLQPMLGCVAVAPPDKQTVRSGWLGSYGGNMDYNGLREGTTLYLPVNQEGALLFVGDGHAAQGDGELTGDALETSMDVEFTVNLIAGPRRGGPRAENDEYIMAMGIANSLPDALREATTELARWLERDYHLTPNESAIVLGTSIRYDVAEIVDPQINIVAKMSKAVLAQLQK